MLSFLAVAVLLFQAVGVSSLPTNGSSKSPMFDLQGHRGGRGDTIENSLPSFAWGIINGVTTLELDNGLTKDGAVVISHDMFIPPEKCRDTAPVFAGDPEFPYVGKFIANLTLAQIKTLDCGSQRLIDFPNQLSYPGTKMSTLEELFSFADCADPQHEILFNIESKISPVAPNTTRGVNDFVQSQHAVFRSSPYPIGSITYQSFDWRTLIAMKALDPEVTTVALISAQANYSSTVPSPPDGISPWLAGLGLSDFPGSSLGVKIANAAHSVKADVLSPSAVSDFSPVPDPTQPGFLPFTTKDMVDQSHALGMPIVPWTVDRLDIADQLLGWGADGIITDFPIQLRRRLEQRGLAVNPTRSQTRVLDCLAEHLQTV